MATAVKTEGKRGRTVGLEEAKTRTVKALGTASSGKLGKMAQGEVQKQKGVVLSG